MNRRYLVIFLMFCIHITSFTHAATAPGGGGRWTEKTVTRVGLDDVIEATARQQVTRNGSSVTLEAVIRKTVDRQAVGRVLLSRLLAGGLLVGTTQSLLDAIGWVMEDGVYIKYKTDDDPTVPPNTEYYIRVSGPAGKSYFGETPDPACRAAASVDLKDGYKREYVSFSGVTSGSCKIKMTWIKTGEESSGFYAWQKVHNPNYDPNKPPKEKQKIVLTDELMGDIAVGDYTDPVDSSKDKKDRKWTGVEDAYQNDPSGTGNELSDALDDSMDNAPETPSKPSTPPEKDGSGQKYPTGKDKGTEGTTDQDKDPTTGEPTGSGSFNLPAWCLWAADQCQWHKEDKKHQEDETKVWEDEKKHRADEKTFWQTIKDFFTKEEHPDDQDTEVEITDDQLPDLDRNLFQASGQCPPDFTYDFPLPLGGTYKISYSYETACFWFSKLYYIIVTVGFAIGLKIITGVESRQDG